MGLFERKIEELSSNPSTINSITGHSATCNPSTSSSRLFTNSGSSASSKQKGEIFSLSSITDLRWNLTRPAANDVNGVERMWTMKKRWLRAWHLDWH
ncbi:hypothetical protein PVL29_004821 [Vitis rotundifolia]|uniref:Uncharacterized protein n=1 Tax=Vitis rotundifolia TaxID=103349 RepID=A0AA39E2Z2_VITRO|nr:hypothetical protein PVL29_004821 [Vitis rotundifolia]